MGIYKFSCPDCLKQFDVDSDINWQADQKASVNCLSGKQPKCTVVCLGLSEALQQSIAEVPPPADPRTTAPPATPPAASTAPPKQDTPPKATTPPPPPSSTPTIQLEEPDMPTRRVAYLEMQSMDGGILRLAIGEGMVQTYGRKSDFDLSDHPIQTDDKKMSRLHFQIETRLHNRQPSYIISDLGSVHGTRLSRQGMNGVSNIQLYAEKDNKQALDGICLEPNDLIMAGSTILRFTIDSVAKSTFSMNDTPDQANYDPNRTTVF
ncbi:FHA domain-containing protein [Fibrella sp. HMF5335]|uniref:FHA domain-containing protein n=1 Tax=Fibrella rubiginis TaxID=2817060 RepID=A0A939GHF4_9BACT|nr:FHA domain-containing protein [Fibrella rubiginis]MBO0939094.1 FHA domain-containing protein [Fibrella rubiginis]